MNNENIDICNESILHFQQLHFVLVNDMLDTLQLFQQQPLDNYLVHHVEFSTHGNETGKIVARSLVFWMQYWLYCLRLEYSKMSEIVYYRERESTYKQLVRQRIMFSIEHVECMQKHMSDMDTDRLQVGDIIAAFKNYLLEEVSPHEDSKDLERNRTIARVDGYMRDAGTKAFWMWLQACNPNIKQEFPIYLPDPRNEQLPTFVAMCNKSCVDEHFLAGLSLKCYILSQNVREESFIPKQYVWKREHEQERKRKLR